MDHLHVVGDIYDRGPEPDKIMENVIKNNLSKAPKTGDWKYMSPEVNAEKCIGCGACVASCKNASAMLFLSAKVSQLALLPQGDPERRERVLNMVKTHDEAGFGNCTNTGACEAECPKGISISHIARLNREYLRAGVSKE